MSGSLSLSSHVTHFDSHPNDEEEAKPGLCRAFGVAFVNALGVGVNTGTWLGMYYLRQVQANYAGQCFIEGTVSDLVSLPFVVGAQCLAGESLGKATIASLVGWFAYHPLDVAYLPTYDLTVAATQNNSLSLSHYDFQPYAEAVFSPAEIAVASTAYLGLFGLFYYGASKVLHHTVGKIFDVSVAVDAYTAASTAIQYMAYYLLDKPFDTDDPLDDGSSDLAANCIALAGLSLFLEMFPMLASSMMSCLIRKNQQPEPHEMSSVTIEEVKASAEEKCAPAIPDEEKKENNLAEHLLSEQDLSDDEEEEIEEEAKPATRTCSSILKSYLCFWNKKPAVVTSSPVSPSFRALSL
jgi:hypothetical protein